MTVTGMEQRERLRSRVNEAGEAQAGGVGRGQLKVTCLWPSVTRTRQMSEWGAAGESRSPGTG